MTRRDFIAGASGTAAVVTVAAPGCTSMPGERAVYLVSRGIGLAAGMVVCECGLSAEAREALAAVVEKVMDATPGPGEAMATTWIGAAKRHLEALVAAGKAKPVPAAVALAAFAVVVYGYALVEMRHPQVGAVRRLVCAAVDGFAEGVLAVVRPSARTMPDCACDAAAYKALQAYSGTAVLKAFAAAVTASGGGVAQIGEK